MKIIKAVFRQASDLQVCSKINSCTFRARSLTCRCTYFHDQMKIIARPVNVGKRSSCTFVHVPCTSLTCTCTVRERLVRTPGPPPCTVPPFLGKGGCGACTFTGTFIKINNNDKNKIKTQTLTVPARSMADGRAVERERALRAPVRRGTPLAGVLRPASMVTSESGSTGRQSGTNPMGAHRCT